MSSSFELVDGNSLYNVFLVISRIGRLDLSVMAAAAASTHAKWHLFFVTVDVAADNELLRACSTHPVEQLSFARSGLTDERICFLEVTSGLPEWVVVK
jgi:hypothetical protein